MACALLAEEIAMAAGGPKDRAYTGGSVHDLGRLALLACYPVEYGNLIIVVRENDFDESECERHLVDSDHCAPGEWLGRHWKLPDDTVAGIAGRHSAEVKDNSLFSVVTAANAVADASDSTFSKFRGNGPLPKSSPAFRSTTAALQSRNSRISPTRFE